MIGLDNCRLFLTGGAPTSEEMKKFFLGLDMPLGECYGMSETGGAVTLNVQINNLYSSGKACEGLSLKIQEPDCNGQGEILMRGRSIFMGYLGLPEKTEEASTRREWSRRP